MYSFKDQRYLHLQTMQLTYDDHSSNHKPHGVVERLEHLERLVRVFPWTLHQDTNPILDVGSRKVDDTVTFSINREWTDRHRNLLICYI